MSSQCFLSDWCFVASWIAWSKCSIWALCPYQMRASNPHAFQFFWFVWVFPCLRMLHTPPFTVFFFNFTHVLNFVNFWCTKPPQAVSYLIFPRIPRILPSRIPCQISRGDAIKRNPITIQIAVAETSPPQTDSNAAKILSSQKIQHMYVVLSHRVCFNGQTYEIRRWFSVACPG